MLGGLAALTAERRSPWKVVLPLGLAAKGTATVWYALSTDYAWAIAAACASGFGGSLAAIAVGSAMMLRSPPAALGRVSSLFEAAGQLGALGALPLMGLVQDLVSPPLILLVCGLVVLVQCLVTALRYVRTGGRAWLASANAVYGTTARAWCRVNPGPQPTVNHVAPCVTGFIS